MPATLSFSSFSSKRRISINCSSMRTISRGAMAPASAAVAVSRHHGVSVCRAASREGFAAGAAPSLMCFIYASLQ
jgi:hypothetical protein